MMLSVNKILYKVYLILTYGTLQCKKNTHKEEYMFDLEDEEIEIKVFNKKTGEEIRTLNFIEHTKEKWEKVVARQLANVLSIDGNSSTMFISFLIKEKDGENRIFGNYNELAKNSGVSVDTVKKIMPKLKKHGFVKSIHRSGIYMVNPKTIRPGRRYQGSVLVQAWEEV